MSEHFEFGDDDFDGDAGDSPVAVPSQHGHPGSLEKTGWENDGGHAGGRINFSNSYYVDYFEANLLNKIHKNNDYIIRKFHKVINDSKNLKAFLEEAFDQGHKIFHCDETIFVTDVEKSFFCKVYADEEGDEPYYIRICGDKKFAEKMDGLVNNNFEKLDAYIKWYYDPEGHSITLPLSSEKLPIKEMYPWLKEDSLEDYYQRYMDSGAAVLILIGPPGTGKTTFIRGLLHYANAAALVSYDEAILNRDSFFANFISNNKEKFMVIEDCDTMIRSREDNNSMMHKFLNISDGLVSKTNKKIIFSTNLPNTRDIDTALLRPGRCFDVIEFDKLTNEQSQKLAEKMGIELSGDATNSIADVLCPKYTISRNAIGKVGFIK